jgi:hypothetical protein
MSKILMEALAFKPDGTLIPTIATLPDNPDGEVVFIIKEAKQFIKKAGLEPYIIIRNSIVETDNAFAFFNMFRFNDDIDLTYDCWLNYHNEIDRKMIAKLCIQKRIIFEYRDSNMKKITQFMIDNTLAPTAREYSLKSFEYGSWSNNDFDILKYSLNNKYPVYMDLWDELEVDS